jgi:hypothetical protein
VATAAGSGSRNQSNRDRGDPAACAVLARAHREALVRHASDDEADPRPRVEPAADELNLGRVVRHQRGGEGGAETAATDFQFLWSGHSMM